MPTRNTIKRLEALESQRPAASRVITFKGLYGQNAPGAWQAPKKQTFADLKKSR